MMKVGDRFQGMIVKFTDPKTGGFIAVAEDFEIQRERRGRKPKEKSMIEIVDEEVEV